MPAVTYLALIVLAALGLQSRLRLLDAFHGLPRYLFCLGLMLFLVSWADFLIYVLCGWGLIYRVATWLVVLAPQALWAGDLRRPAVLRAGWIRFRAGLVAHRQWNYCLLFFILLVLSRFYMGLETIHGEVWCNFNFADTPFHLSVANAFVVAPRFPPMDLDMAPYPLKYHFLADFFVAHLFKLGLSRIQGMWLMNLLSAAAMVGAVWATFERWLKLSARWVLLAGLIFLFLNPALLNLLHYWIFHPDFFRPSEPFYGLFAYPFFNFEAMLTNLLEPQRGFLFTLPIILLILHILFGDDESEAATESAEEQLSRRRHFLMAAFILICLLPLAHIAAFVLLAVTAMPALWVQRGWFFARWRWWGAAFALCLLQLAYVFAYVPPPGSAYPALLTFPLLPSEELAGFSRLARRTVFWLLTDGDFLVWGLLFAVTAVFYQPLGRFLRRWKWYFFVCAGFFILINFFFFFPFEWGDNNKFVLFLNLGLTLVIVLGASQWIGRRGAWRSILLWYFFFALCVVPTAYEYYHDVFTYPDAKILLFGKNGRKAAAWLRLETKPTDVVLTAADNIIHFVTPLAGRPTLAGIYGNTNVYRQEKREEEIRRIYEKGDFGLVHKLGVRYVCISRNERRLYQISGRWTDLMVSGQAVAFHSGDPDDVYSVFLFDAKMLPAH